ncbi:unnamed protein product [Tuber aestivum]|uniref:SH3 domain-containing protein n=1 Tax=Tuber aestivum TaxID=59557 RepID=A0A292PNN1_9PEZI|nr:unnamed protein product [Tuber aestivum]
MANTSAPPFKVKALFDYNSPHDDDLNFPANEVITVTEEEDADWYYGEYHDKSTGELRQGIFPRNFVERIVVELPPRPTRGGGGRRKPVEEHQPEPPVEYQDDTPRVKSPPPPAPVAEPSPPAAQSHLESPIAAPNAYETHTAIHQEKPDPAQPAPSPSVAKPAPAFKAPPKQSPAPSVERLAPSSSKPPPLEKPSSFKDRLALFNKGSAAPIAPFNPHKPPVNFIKKPFVPPPPSKHAYVPPPIQNVPKPRRDEDSNYGRPDPDEAPARGSTEQEREKEDEGPKMTLKDRMALLQNQQLDPTGLGWRNKRPPKPKRNEGERTLEDDQSHTAPEDNPHEYKSHDSTGPQATEREGLEVAPKPKKKSVDISREDTAMEESSAGDADISSASGYTGEETVTSRGRPPISSHREDKSDDGDDEGANDDTPDNPDSDDEEVDPEVARKMAIRERIAKMSGGMGMHGMFGGMPMGGPPPPPPKKKSSLTSGPPKEEDESLRRSSNDGDESENKSSSDYAQAPPVALPFGLPRVQSPPAAEQQRSDSEAEELARDMSGASERISEEHSWDEVADAEDIKPQQGQQAITPHPQGPRPMPGSPILEKRHSQISPHSIPQDRPAPPPIPNERPAPPPPPSEPPTAQMPPAVARTPSDGSVSDDELSIHTGKLNISTSELGELRAAPPPPPSGPPSIPSGRPGSSYDALSPTSPTSKRVSQGYFNAQSSPTASPVTPGGQNKRASYQRAAGTMPPIPMSSPPSMSRPPPPPPPSGPPPRASVDESRPDLAGSQGQSDTEEEVTEYEADYDTDIGNKVAHRDALKGKEVGRRDSYDDGDGGALLPPSVTSPHAPPRNVPLPPPPAPPSNPPPSRKGRQSMDMPRAAPPPPPPAPQAQEPERYEDHDDYDPYNYESPRLASPPPPPTSGPLPPLLHQVPPSQRDQPRSSTGRQSMDSSRPAAGRRSMEQGRPVAEFIARDVDLGERSQWWKTPKTPPPIFQNRSKELHFEVEESTSTRRGGRTTVTKDVYVLFNDYSQTVVTARYDRDDPANASLEQRHEQPPPNPRQDQLEEFQTKYGANIYVGARSRENTVVGDGEPHTLIHELFKLVPNALSPAGHRSYGALVYANLANANTILNDEIRAGDILTFRNAKFQGHKGGLHQKYSMDVGKPDHVAIVVDWDGTKKKVRAYDQGRESRKVKIDSFKIGDLRSGEVKVWRVVGRDWVGWGQGEQ